jgi:hypothetical protein
MRCKAGSNSVMPDFLWNFAAHPYRRGVAAAIRLGEFVVPGLVPGIHVFKTALRQRRG